VEKYRIVLLFFFHVQHVVAAAVVQYFVGGLGELVFGFV